PVASFRWAADCAAFPTCTSPKSYGGAPDGSHTFEVKATDAAGNTGAAAGFSWTVDTTGPSVTITSGPSDPSNSSGASFGFSSDPGATFHCPLDGAVVAAGTSPHVYSGIADGSHTLQVKATDGAGNTGPVAVFTWTVDTAAPAVNISGSPTNPSNSASPSFSFSSEAGASFQCSIDGGPFAGCTSAKSYSGLADGSHAFRVRASDAAGNTGAASYTWTIDTSAPTATITSSPSDPSNSTSPSNSASPSFGFTSAAGASFQCSLDGAAFAGCASPKSYTGVADGSHVFEVSATDAAGNVGAAASYTWTVDTSAPTASITAKPSDPSKSTVEIGSASGRKE